jgi:hypothetical protein
VDRRAIVFSIIAIAGLVSACGGGTKTASTTTASKKGPVPHDVAHGGLPPLKTTSYQFGLTGNFRRTVRFEGGEPSATGLAVVTINAPKRELCWTFTHVSGLHKPTVLRVFRMFPGATGRGGLPLGPYRSSGCKVLTERSLRAIERIPEKIYVSVSSRRRPEGAIHGSLVPSNAYEEELEAAPRESRE